MRSRRSPLISRSGWEVTKPGQMDIASISVALKLLRTMVRR
jgi:hypothetical protein